MQRRIGDRHLDNFLSLDTAEVVPIDFGYSGTLSEEPADNELDKAANGGPFLPPGDGARRQQETMPPGID